MKKKYSGGSYATLIILLIVLILLAAILASRLKGNGSGVDTTSVETVKTSVTPSPVPNSFPSNSFSDETQVPNELSPEISSLPPVSTNEMASEPTPVLLDIDAAFYSTNITDDIFERIYGKSYPFDCTLSLDTLKYVHVLHYDFNGNIEEGELIVNADISDIILEIFRELFDIEYPIEKMLLIDAYNADDELSMEDNNTSAFNYRVVAGTEVLSNHALGLAIDINPLYNPYVYTKKDGSVFLQPYNAEAYVDRNDSNPYFIRKDDDCYNIFISHGFSWGGDWNTKKDYQHFEWSN